MKLLAIDTSTELASVALAVQDEIDTEEQMGVRQHAQLLLPMIERLLASAECSFNQLDAIVFGCGPGSFTGLRIACSVAKGLAYANDLPLFPVSSLLAIAYGAYQVNADLPTDTPVLATIDARMNQLYWGCFTKMLEPVEEQVAFASDILLPNKRPFILAGVGFESYVPQLPPPLNTQLIKQSTVFPRAENMIRLVQGGGSIHPVSAAEALPVYIRNQVTHVMSTGETRG